MKYEITKINYSLCTIYSLNNIISIAFTNDNKIDLNLSKPISKSIPENQNIIDINDAEKYINADINMIGLICSCRLIDISDSKNKSVV